jgi:hypothetical protein
MMPSLQDGTTQLPSKQESVTQSLFSRHAWPSLHGSHSPPQSTSVSLPLINPSLPEAHANDSQTENAASSAAWAQWSLSQSVLLAQMAPFSQAAHCAPQSTSVSTSASSSPFSQCGG